MAANTGALAGKTLFITGASRGIGKAIALKAARDGANVVIAAKTAEPHPKLPGTIYTAAEEVESVGGKALACIVDIRYEDQVKDAMEKAAQKFGGIDILVNNASAISLTGTAETSMKKYDLMMGINGRGTYLCSQVALPYLKKGRNAHILNLSPPLNMSAKWFQNHVAYTMAKYGMSMCALGMSEEFRPFKIAVNALWPRTAIYTAAMELLGGGKGIINQCRTTDIISDAAYIMLSRDSSTYTGNFAVDDEVLRSAGVTDLEQYSCVPGSKLMIDFFLDEDPSLASLNGNTSSSSSTSSGSVGTTMETLKSLLNPDLVKSIDGVFVFELKGSEAGTWYLDLKTGSGSVGEGAPSGGEPGCIMTLDSEDFVKMFRGELQATSAFMSGKLKIKGNMGLAMKLDKLMGQMKSKL